MELVINPNYNSDINMYNNKGSRSMGGTLFDNIPDIIRPIQAAELLGLSVSTIYDWKYRSKTKNIPSGLFFKLNRLLYIRTEVLRIWIHSSSIRSDYESEET